jgi:hypothetical protein
VNEGTAWINDTIPASLLWPRYLEMRDMLEYVHFRVLSLHFTDQSVETRTKMATQWPIRYHIAR